MDGCDLIKKLIQILFLSLILLGISVASAESLSDALDPKGYGGFPWKTDLKVIQKEKMLTYLADNDSEAIYLSKTDSTENLLFQYLFSQDKFVGVMVQYTKPSEYKDAMKEMTAQWGKPEKESNYFRWHFKTTIILATEATQKPIIAFLYRQD